MQLFVAALAFQYLASLVHCEFDGGPHCSELNSSTIDGFLADQLSPSLVIYHSETCSVCVQTMPKFVAAAEEAAKQNIAARFAHVNCGSERAVCGRFNVTRYPGILFFEAGSVAEQSHLYNNPRNEASFVGYVKRMMGPRVKRISEASELQRELVNEEYAGLIMVEPSKFKMDELPASVAEAVESWRSKHRFFVTNNLGAVLPKEFTHAAKGASMVAYSTRQWSAAHGANEGGGMDAFFGDLTGKDNISEWISHHRFPGVANLTLQSLWEFTHSEKKAVIVAIDPSHDNNDVDASVRKALQKFSDQFYFGIIDGVSVAETLDRFSIYVSELPRVLLGEDNFELWIEDDEKLTAVNLVTDLQALLDGAPLLRQGPFWAIPLYQFRKVKRLASRVRAYSEQGPFEKAVCMSGFVVIIVLIVLVKKIMVIQRRKDRERALEYERKMEKIIEDRAKRLEEKKQRQQLKEAQMKDGKQEEQQEDEGLKKRR